MENISGLLVRWGVEAGVGSSVGQAYDPNPGRHAAALVFLKQTQTWAQSLRPDRNRLNVRQINWAVLQLFNTSRRNLRAECGRRDYIPIICRDDV